MERDTQLKNLLTKGVEAASAGFTESILEKIDGLVIVKPSYKPLVSDTIKKIFIVAFASVVGMILLLCLIIKSSQLTFINLIQLPKLSAETNYNFFAFILSFWLVFIVNTFIQKNRFRLN